MQKLCCICKKTVDSDTASILTVGGFGNAKYLCDECSAELDAAIGAREFDAVKAAMDSIGDKMAKNNIEDELVIVTVGDLFINAKKRAKAIKDGSYDFSLDNAEDVVEESLDGEEHDIPDESLDCEQFDIPEELKETEEDKELDAKERKKNAFFDKIFNWISLAIILIGLAAVVYLIFFR